MKCYQARKRPGRRDGGGSGGGIKISRIERRQFELQLKAYKEILNVANQIDDLWDGIPYECEDPDKTRARCKNMWENQLRPKFEQFRLLTLLVLEAYFGRNSRYYDIFETYSSGDIDRFGNKRPIHGAISALTAMEAFIVEP